MTYLNSLGPTQQKTKARSLRHVSAEVAERRLGDLDFLSRASLVGEKVGDTPKSQA
jgi:hypothetical protein